MKKLMILTVLVFSMAMQESKAQLSISVNIGSQPSWGPVGYDYVDYYYMPDIDAYYYVPQQQFIYLEHNNWVFARSLPSRYSWYNINNGYKVVINEPRPYLRNNVYRTKYKNYKGRNQEFIRNSHDSRYKNNRPDYNDNRGNDNNRDNGNGKSKGKGRGRGHGQHEPD